MGPMNMTKVKTFELAPLHGVKQAVDLVTRKTAALDAPLKLAPRTTVVLYLGNDAN
jgi:hypothetical protein